MPPRDSLRISIEGLGGARHEIAIVAHEARSRLEAVIKAVTDLTNAALKENAPRYKRQGANDPRDPSGSTALYRLIHPAPLKSSSTGVESGVLLPHKTIFTLPPGTKAHKIPAGGSTRGIVLSYYWSKSEGSVYRVSAMRGVGRVRRFGPALSARQSHLASSAGNASDGRVFFSEANIPAVRISRNWIEETLDNITDDVVAVLNGAEML